MIGEIEPVTIKQAGMTLPARIDTGATTSSIDAGDIKRFEKDGKKWVRFTLKDRKSGKTITMESKLTRDVQIKRHGKEPQERPVVKIAIALGTFEQECEFSLTDRSAYEFPVLIGRNVLEGEFVVDVSRKNTTSAFNGK